MGRILLFIIAIGMLIVVYKLGGALLQAILDPEKKNIKKKQPTKKTNTKNGTVKTP